MQIRALKTFNGRFGLIRTGTTPTLPDRYAKELISKGLAVRHVPGENLPGANTDLGGAPSNMDLGGPENTKAQLGNDDGGSEEDETDDETPDQTSSQPDRASGSTASSSEGRKGGGRARPLSSQQVARRSRKKT